MQSHSGFNLAMVFANVLKEFGIADKVSIGIIYEQPETHQEQVLSITCDNASCNNVMIAELAKVVPNFSEVGHTQCFLHIVNLVTKSIIRQFDTEKKLADKRLDEAEAAEQQESRSLVDDIALETLEEAMGQCGINAVDVGYETDDDIEGWVDEMRLLLPSERERDKENIRPVTLVLVKVRYQ
jgi:hypothetical protein